MVCTTVRPTAVAYPQISFWKDCLKFVNDFILYENLEEPTNLVSTNLFMVLFRDFTENLFKNIPI